MQIQFCHKYDIIIITNIDFPALLAGDGSRSGEVAAIIPGGNLDFALTGSVSLTPRLSPEELKTEWPPAVSTASGEQTNC
jgi:hypothetical protein